MAQSWYRVRCCAGDFLNLQAEPVGSRSKDTAPVLCSKTLSKIDGDVNADFEIFLNGAMMITAGDFVL